MCCSLACLEEGAFPFLLVSVSQGKLDGEQFFSVCFVLCLFLVGESAFSWAQKC